MKAQIKKIWLKDNRAEHQRNIEEYEEAVLAFLNEVGKDNIIDVSDNGYLTTIYYWEEE